MHMGVIGIMLLLLDRKIGHLNLSEIEAKQLNQVGSSWTILANKVVFPPHTLLNCNIGELGQIKVNRIILVFI